MRTYHHIGIPSHTPRPGEYYLEPFKMYVLSYEHSPYGVEWIRFEPDSPIPELVQRIPHVAFVTNDLDAELAGQEILIPPNSPSPGVRVAFIIANGAPVEFLQFIP